jgi:type IV secretory pathway VirB10-like protein
MSSKKEKPTAAALRAQIAKLQEEIKTKAKALREEERRLETRKKVLLGVVLQAWVDEGKVNEAELQAGLDKHLKRKDERALFGLDPLPEEKPAAPTPTTKKAEDKPAPSPPPATDKKKPKTASPQQETGEGPTQKKTRLKEADQGNLAAEFEGLE